MGGIEVQNFKGHEGGKYLCLFAGRRKSSIVDDRFDAIQIPQLSQQCTGWESAACDHSVLNLEYHHLGGNFCGAKHPLAPLKPIFLAQFPSNYTEEAPIMRCSSVFFSQLLDLPEGVLALICHSGQAAAESPVGSLQLDSVLVLKFNLCNYVGVTSCTHVHYGDSCHFAIVKAFMVATNF